MPDDNLNNPDDGHMPNDETREGDQVPPSQANRNPADRPEDVEADAGPGGDDEPGPPDEVKSDNRVAGDEPGTPKKPGKGPPKRVKMQKHWAEDADEAKPEVSLQLVRLGSNETAMIPFSDDMEIARIHYVEEPEIPTSVWCNQEEEGGDGPACALCLAGQKVDEKGLLPVYVPATESVAVLAIGAASHPGALRPKVMPITRSPKRLAMLISKPDRMSFKVSTVELAEGIDDGAATIKAFLRRWEAGEVELGSVFPRIGNRELAAIPRIATLLRLKGIDPDGLG